MRQFSIILTLLLCILSAPAFADDHRDLEIEVVSLGLARVEDRGSVSAMELLAEPAEPPKITQKEGEMPRVAAMAGHQFGYRFTLKGPREGVNWLLRFVTLHPDMHNPRKPGPIHMHTYDAGMSVGETRFNGFKFTEEYELVPGVWTFEIYEQDLLLHSLSFEVYLP